MENELFNNSLNKIKQEYNKLKNITCCFTGHRPQKLPWGFNEKDEGFLKIAENARKAIEDAINSGFSIFICGMALGFDMLCAEIVLEFKCKYPHIKLVCAVPCKGQERLWRKSEQIRYQNLLQQADKIRCVYNSYVDGCMQERNNYMINNSSLVITLFNGLNGGTKNTLLFAKQQGLKIVNVFTK